MSEVGGLNELATPWYSDQILPFDVTLAGCNEYGAMCAAKIFGVEILNEGQGISIDDAVSEMQATFVARAVEPIEVVTSPWGNSIGRKVGLVVLPNPKALAHARQGPERDPAPAPPTRRRRKPISTPLLWSEHCAWGDSFGLGSALDCLLRRTGQASSSQPPFHRRWIRSLVYGLGKSLVRLSLGMAGAVWLVRCAGGPSVRVRWSGGRREERTT